MNYTTQQKEQIRANLYKIVDYIEAEILPQIAYSYETGNFGPTETWGRWSETTGRRYHIALNGPYKDKIRFYCRDIPYTADELVTNYPNDAVVFLEYWQDAKSYMNVEIMNNRDTINLIKTFEI